VAKFTGTNSVGNSIIYDNGTNVGIGTTEPYGTLHIAKDNWQAINLGTSSDPSVDQGNRGITWGYRTDGNPYYMIRTNYKTYGSYTYSRLQIGWHTGIEIGAASAYGGTRFYNNSPFTGSQIMSIGDGDDNVRINNNLYVGTLGVWLSSWLNQALLTTSDPTFNSVYLANGNNRLYQGGGYSTHIQNPYGYLEIGPQNASWSHFQTDRPAFYFNKQVTVDGPLTNYSNAYYLAQSGNSYLNGGNVGIGTTGPGYKLDVQGGIVNVGSGYGFHTATNDSWFPYTNGWNYFRGPTYAFNSTWYDENDSGYYIDPNNTSIFNDLRADAYYYRGNTAYGFIGSNVYADTINTGSSGDPLELNYYRSGDIRFTGGDLTMANYRYIYPGRTDGGGDYQKSWYLASNGSWGLYTNTSFNAAGGLYDAGSRVAISRGEGRNYIDYSRYVYDNGAYQGAGWKEPSSLGVYYAYLGRLVYNNGAYSGSGWVEPSDLGVRYAASAGSITGQGALATRNNVGTGQINTATGSQTQRTTLAMNDYNFFPNIDGETCSPWNIYLTIYFSNAPNDTVGRFGAPPCDSGNWVARWRYITASDHPTIWLIANSDGSISSVWQAEDPIRQYDYPENPSPFAGTKLAAGQREANVAPLSISQLEALYSSLPLNDQAEILSSLKSYIVDKRQWLSDFSNLSDLSLVSERYNPAARFWAMRKVAEYYQIDPASLIQEAMIFDGIGLSLKSDPYGAIVSYLNLRTQVAAQQAEQQAQNDSLPQTWQKADIAEWYASDTSTQTPEAGDIVSVTASPNRPAGLIAKTTKETAEHIIGVISTSPSQVLGNKESANDVKVAAVGRVPVKVSLENGPIAIGDRITISSTPGVGMKYVATSTSSGQATVGIALESFDGLTNNSDGSQTVSQTGKILILFNLGYAPQLAAAKGTIDLATLNTDLNLNGFAILNVKSITSISGLWSIDENGNLIVQSVNTQALTIGGGSASGVTIYDRETTAPKCIYIEGGVIKTSDGACGATTNAGTAATIPGILPAAASSIPGISATTTPDLTATITPTSAESGVGAPTESVGAEPILTAISTPAVAPASEPIATTTEPVIISETATTTP
jgi:hypothetical protein